MSLFPDLEALWQVIQLFIICLVVSTLGGHLTIRWIKSKMKRTKYFLVLSSGHLVPEEVKSYKGELVTGLYITPALPFACYRVEVQISRQDEAKYIECHEPYAPPELYRFPTYWPVFLEQDDIIRVRISRRRYPECCRILEWHQKPVKMKLPVAIQERLDISMH